MRDPEQDSKGWRQLISGYPWFAKPGAYPLPAYSEFMPPPRLGRTPYGDIDLALFTEDDPYGWHIPEIEEEYQLKPGVEHIVRQVMAHLLKLGQGFPDHAIAGRDLQNLEANPYWPAELAARAGQLTHERYLAFLPLALSKTQDDKGRVMWTFFGSSHLGPERVFWKSFYRAPGQELPAEEGLAFFCRLLSSVYGEAVPGPEALLPVGFRILNSQSLLPQGSPLPAEELPSWTQPFITDAQVSGDEIHYLLTFCPFDRLPGAIKARYLAGQLNLLPFPGSLVFWGMPGFLRLQEELPLALQIPMLRLASRHSGPYGVRVPQSGWLHEPRPGEKPDAAPPEEMLVHHYRRSHRWEHIHRFEQNLNAAARIEKVVKVLFSTDLEVLGLYDKPMARNCQLWDQHFNLLLDGPQAHEKEIYRAEYILDAGGLFGYRFHFPAMRVGKHSVYWHRLAIAYLAPSTGSVELLPEPPLGYLIAYPEDEKDLANPIELWPRLLDRDTYCSALLDFTSEHDYYVHQTALNLLSLMDAWEALGRRSLARSFARQLLRVNNAERLKGWIASLETRASRPSAALRMQSALADILEPEGQPVSVPEAITCAQTATRTFEQAYWDDIRSLATGEFQNKDNADCVDDPATLSVLAHTRRDLARLGDTLLSRYQAAIVQAGMQGKALVGDLPFKWRTDFNFPRFGGWQSNQEGHAFERDLLVVIPGKDRSRPVVLADHYDTAYMEDLYEKSRGGTGARKAAAGADDNHSATAALLQAAPIYLELARQGRLERDIWLLHLTGEEFPADCLGARHFSQCLIEHTLKLRLAGEQWVDLSYARPAGIFVMDMIAHNRDDDRDIFQISPGKSAASLELAYQAHLANLAWNAAAEVGNRSPARAGCSRGKRSPDGFTIPETAALLRLNGEVRTWDDPASSLFNTDGQIFSDIGAPVVLFMENYDINRSGYHDTHDTLENIDLDYGAALASIAIETVARLALKP